MSENEYEVLRQKNIAERNAIFADFFQDVKQKREELNDLVEKDHSRTSRNQDSENEPPKKRRRRSASNTESFRGSNIRIEFRKKYNTRSRARRSMSNGSNNSEDEDETVSEPTGNKPKLRVLFPWAKPFERTLDLMRMGVCDVDEEEEERHDSDSIETYTSKRRVLNVSKTPYDPENIPSVDEITDEMLNNIAEKSSGKDYCKINGTSCHQCRQKTLDTKTVCRSGECVGVRGQFCGPCLRGRYGESAHEALKDPDWACPPCRGLCNCSICRTRSGLAPTGILAPVAQEEGYDSVMDYLQVTE